MAAAEKGTTATQKRNQRRRKSHKYLKKGIKVQSTKLITYRKTIPATNGRRHGLSVSTATFMPEINLPCISAELVLTVTEPSKVYTCSNRNPVPF